jgi:hypothetical protein
MQKPLFFALALAAVPPSPALAGPPPEDVKAYCARVGNDDRVKPIPPDLVAEAIRLFYVAPPGAEQVEKSTVYRCMSGALWLCDYGANLTCGKADVSRVSKGAESWCKENPGSAVVPMAATGHDTIYTWRCIGEEPRPTASAKVDQRGFFANQWRRLD